MYIWYTFLIIIIHIVLIKLQQYAHILEAFTHIDAHKYTTLKSRAHILYDIYAHIVFFNSLNASLPFNPIYFFSFT